MNRCTPFALALSLAVALPAVADDASRLARVESGLRGPVSFTGDPTWTLEERLRHYQVPGLSLAIIDQGRVVATRAYGLADRQSGTVATPDTLFQAASISKPLAAFAAMRLVEQGKLSLDKPVNERLATWKIPDNELTARQPVTLAHLLSHTGGLTVHGFGGYEAGQPLPTREQILDGLAPANSPAVRVDLLPGSAFRYSGGGYTVAQVLMSDTQQRPFPSLMKSLVFKPLAMDRSTVRFPLPPKWAPHAAAGVMPDGRDVPGKHKVHPESAAAGLWTTPADLARFAIEVQRALHGESSLMKRETATRMLAEVRDGYALGFGLTRQGDARYFGHDGWNDGFCSSLVANTAGQGVVIMINGNQPQLMQEVRRAVAHAYGWPGYASHPRAPVDKDELARLPGRYRYNEEQYIAIERDGEQLYFRYGGEPRTELVHVGGGRYFRADRDTGIGFAPGENGRLELRFEASVVPASRHPRLAEGQRLPRELLEAGDEAGADAAYRALAAKADMAGSEDYLNRQGMRLVDMKQFDQAIALLALVTRLHPGSANTWDSLGYAYWRKGELDQARRHYLKALEIDPGFASAKAALAEIR